MRRSNLFVLFGGLLVATAMAAACGSSTAATCTAALALTTGCTVPATVTTPAVTTTETFSGSIGLNGAASYNFTVTAAGTVVGTLTTLTGGPSGATVGFSLGTWNGATCSTGAGLFTDAAVQGTVVSATVSTAGSLCVRLYDAAGTLTPGVSYTVTVVHP
jgi:hypothetical protein